MSLPFKVIIGGFVVLSAALTGIYLNNYLNKEPRANSLIVLEEKELKGISKLGENKHKLVANTKENKEFWEWKYRNVLEKDLASLDNSNLFSRVNLGFNQNDKNKERSLNRVCGESYIKEAKDIESIKESILKYCTFRGTEELSWS